MSKLPFDSISSQLKILELRVENFVMKFEVLKAEISKYESLIQALELANRALMSDNYVLELERKLVDSTHGSEMRVHEASIRVKESEICVCKAESAVLEASKSMNLSRDKIMCMVKGKNNVPVPPVPSTPLVPPVPDDNDNHDAPDYLFPSLQPKMSNFR